MDILTIGFKLLLSLFLGGVIGIERGIKNRPAGFSTYILVSCSATLIMITNIYLYSIYPDIDPTRLAAQIVSGIGFLGAGTIITTRKNEIRGLTTAAGLWAAAAIGIAVGCGFYVGAGVGAVTIIFALTGLKKLDIYIKEHAKNIELYIEYNNDFSLSSFKDYIKGSGYIIYDIDRGRNITLDGEIGTLHFFLDLKKLRKHTLVMADLESIKGVENVREIF